jgi:hypothetical protein
MDMDRTVKRVILLAVLLIVPAIADAQQATMTGVVTDASGGVLPGVTVEASSPVLIEKVRSAVTDGTGQFRIVSLPSGTYTITFTLTGFNKVKREGIELAGTLTATVDIEMRVGALEETITVTGASPVVDLQSARRQAVIDGNVLQAIPTSRSYNNVLQLVPGVDPGTAQIQLSPTMLLFTAHGGSTQDGRLTVDGVNTGASRGGSGVSGYVPDMQNTQEVAFTISGNLGEAETGGPQMTIVPKYGGNRFSGSFFATGINEALQGNNFTPRLQAAGLVAPPKIIRLFDVQASIGGPISKDHLWFFYNYRTVGRADAQPGIFANKNAGDPNTWTYDPDFSLQGRNDTRRRINALRLTWQMTTRNKLSAFYDDQPACTGAAWVDGSGACRTTAPGDGWIPGGSQVNGFFGAGPNAPETGDYQYNPQRVQQVKWQSPVTSRLLLEAAAGVYASRWGYDERPGNPTRDLVRVQEQGLIPGTGLSNLKYRSSNWPNGRIGAHTWNFSASYVTGAHNFKAGYQGAFHRDIDQLFGIVNNTQRLTYRFLNGVPNQLTMDSGPWTRQVRTEYAAGYVQDSWTTGRLTTQAALRFDHAWSYFPPQQIGPDRFLPTAIAFPRTDGILGYNDFSPRVGVAYDLSGDGKTSLKVNIGKYLAPATNEGRYTAMNPVQRLVAAGQNSINTNRSWIDANGNYFPDCDLMNSAAQDLRPGGGDFCGAWSDQNFGKAKATTTLDPSLQRGWAVRPSDWQFGVSVQREVLPRTSIEVGYYRRWWQHFVDATDNLLTTSSSYGQYFVTAPPDPRLPNGGGNQVGPFFDVVPTLFGQSNNVTRLVEDAGDYVRHSNFFDVNVSARLQNGLTLQGGTSTGSVYSNSCDIRSNLPEFTVAVGGPTATNPFCLSSQPWLTTVKAIGTYLVPKVDVLFSGTFSSVPGVALAATVNYPSGAGSPIAQSLGRTLSSAATTSTLSVLAPETLYGDRANDLDLRIGKIIKAGRTRSNVALDIVNVFNSDAVLTYNSLLGTYSTSGAFTPNATWPTPTAVLQARLARISVTFDW